MSKRIQIKIVPFKRDSDFFFRTGLKYAEKKMASKALRYLETAVEMEPFNADYQFNLACVWAELKDSQRSNGILLHIIKNIDPTFTECYFSIGCNYFELGNFSKAREYFEKYIYYSSEGEYVEEAYDILYYIQIYENMGADSKKGKLAARLAKEGHALLEQGHYPEASERLEKCVEADPKAVQPRNDLAEACFQRGDGEKAVSLAKSVLKLDPANMEALCSLLLFYRSLNRLDQYEELLRQLTDVEVRDRDELLRLVKAYAELKEHSCLVKTLIRHLKTYREPEFFNLLSIAFYNMGQCENAVEVWSAMVDLFPQRNVVSRYYLSWVKEQELKTGVWEILEYTSSMPGELEKVCRERLHACMRLEPAMVRKLWKKDIFIKDMLLYYLYEGEIEDRLRAVDILAAAKSSEARFILKNMMNDMTLPEEVRNRVETILEPAGTGARKEKLAPKEADSLPVDAQILKWRSEWEDVIDCALKNKEKLYSPGYKNEIRSIWLSFISKAYPGRLPIIKKSEIWAAALEYIYCNLHLIRVSKKRLAEKYNISPASITNRLKDFT